MPRTIHPAKRLFDIVVTLLLAPFVVVFTCIACSALFIEHILYGHPFDAFFYLETRITAGKPFAFYKFNIFEVVSLQVCALQTPLFTPKTSNETVESHSLGGV